MTLELTIKFRKFVAEECELYETHLIITKSGEIATGFMSEGYFGRVSYSKVSHVADMPTEDTIKELIKKDTT